MHEEIIPNVKQYDDSLAEAEKKVDDFDFLEAALKLLIERKKRVQTKHDLMVQAAKAGLEQFRATSNGVVRLVMEDTIGVQVKGEILEQVRKGVKVARSRLEFEAMSASSRRRESGGIYCRAHSNVTVVRRICSAQFGLERWTG